MAWEEPRKTGMQYRRLGNSGLHVSALGLGGWLTTGGMSTANALRNSAQVQD
jgi:aryl-alcohol dehydrogenase-like predicted oxidoreductase